MTPEHLHNILIAAVAWLVIVALRSVPFVIFAKSSSGKESPSLKKAEKYLSPIIIGLLVVYSFSGLEWRTASPYIAGAAVVLLQLVLKSGLSAILLGTLLYMFLVH